MQLRSFGIRVAALAVAAILVSAVATGCDVFDRGGRAGGSSVAIDTTVGHAPAGVRIQVEVLNASKVKGAARRATFLLRARGYDVVSTGNASTLQDETVVLDRSHHPDWSALIAKAINGTASERPDTSAYLDATVILGAKWTPPPMPFHP
jgi:hypothetical protein